MAQSVPRSKRVPNHHVLRNRASDKGWPKVSPMLASNQVSHRRVQRTGFRPLAREIPAPNYFSWIGGSAAGKAFLYVRPPNLLSLIHFSHPSPQFHGIFGIVYAAQMCQILGQKKPLARRCVIDDALEFGRAHASRVTSLALLQRRARSICGSITVTGSASETLTRSSFHFNEADLPGPPAPSPLPPPLGVESRRVTAAT